jgi:hypothetical protein
MADAARSRRPAPVEAEVGAHLLLDALTDAATTHPHLVPLGRVTKTRMQNLAYAQQLVLELGAPEPLIAQIPQLLTIAQRGERITSPLGLLRTLATRAAVLAAQAAARKAQADADWGFHQTPDYAHRAGDTFYDIEGRQWEYVPDPAAPGQLTKVLRLPDTKTPVSGRG